MKRTAHLLVLALAAGAAPLAMAASLCDGINGNLVMNCGFELPSGGAGTVPTDWSGSQFTGFEAVVNDPVNSGDQSMRIANDEFQGGEPLFNGAAIMSQTFTDTPGEQYAFDFYLYNGSPNGAEEQFQAFWDPSATPTADAPIFTDSGSLPASYTLESFTVTGTGSDTITFTSYNTPSYYYLDDVSLVDTGTNVGGSTTPEPGSFFLLAGMIPFAIWRCRGSRNIAG